MNLADYLLNSDTRDGDVALVCLDGQHTRGELREAVNRVGAFLLQSGAKQGDRAVLIANNSLFWAVSYLGCINVGCVAVPVSPTLDSAELSDILRCSTPRFAFIESNRLSAVAPQLAADTIVISDVPAVDGIGANIHPVSIDDLPANKDHMILDPIDDRRHPAALMFTSGSTGRPRAVMVSHRNIIANTESIINYLGLSSHDRVMAVLPFHYCFGTSLLHTHLRVGASIVIDNRFMYPNVVLERMQASECTGFAGVPSHYQILLRASRFRQMQFPHLRWLQQAGGNLPAPFVDELHRVLPHVRIFVMYGQTEATARLSYVPPELLAQKTGSIGIAIPGVTLRIVKEDGSSALQGDMGEIEASGDNIALGYWGDQEHTASVFRDGRLRTGDLARADEDGYLYIVDRARDFVKCAGVRVSCKRIEDVLLEFDDLVEAAVIGVPDEVLGEAIKAFVVCKKNKERDVIERLWAFCRSRLHHSLVPKELVVLRALPKNDAGKVLKSVLRSRNSPPVKMPERSFA